MRQAATRFRRESSGSVCPARLPTGGFHAANIELGRYMLGVGILGLKKQDLLEVGGGGS